MSANSVRLGRRNDAQTAGDRAYALASMDREPQLVGFFGRRFIYLLQFRLLLGKEAIKHCPLGWVGFGVKHQLEPVDIGLNNSFQEGPPVKSDIRGPLPRTCLIELLGAGIYVPLSKAAHTIVFLSC